MRYSWENTKKIEEGFDLVFLDNVNNIITKIELEKKVKIKGIAGVGEKYITPTLISINGDCNKKEAYETFSLSVYDITRCQTNNLPYDQAVFEILNLAAEYGYIKNIKTENKQKRLIYNTSR